MNFKQRIGLLLVSIVIIFLFMLTVDGTNGEAVTNMISCILTGSEKARQGYNDLRETFMSGYDG